MIPLRPILLLAALPIVGLTARDLLEERVTRLEERVAGLELTLSQHDKTYHFTCEYEDCLTTEELILLHPTGYDGRDRSPCRGMCGGHSMWNGVECVCPEGESDE